MKILCIRPEPPGSAALARVNVELANGIKLFGLKLKGRGDQHFVFGPNAGGTSVVTFPPAIVDEIAALALAELERKPHDGSTD